MNSNTSFWSALGFFVLGVVVALIGMWVWGTMILKKAKSANPAKAGKPSEETCAAAKAAAVDAKVTPKGDKEEVKK